MEEIIFRFFELVESLESDKDVTIFRWETFQGASQADFDYCEELAQITIDKDIRDFFQVTNGMQLFWASKDLNLQSLNKIVWTQGCLPDDYGDGNIGCINIWPIRQIFETDWSETVYFEEDRKRTTNFEGKTFSSYDFKRRFFPFDLYSKYNCFGFFALENEELTKVLLAQDYYIDFKFSIPTNFRSYLEFLLASKASIPKRKFFAGDKLFSNKLVVGNKDYWEKELLGF